jgi:hypothetical protein
MGLKVNPPQPMVGKLFGGSAIVSKQTGMLLN